MQDQTVEHLAEAWPLTTSQHNWHPSISCYFLLKPTCRRSYKYNTINELFDCSKRVLSIEYGCCVLFQAFRRRVR